MAEKKTNKTKSAGRPRIAIDQSVFEGLCEIQCTLSEVAHVLGCSEDTIERWCKRTYSKRFADIYEEKRDFGRKSIRRAQYEKAVNAKDTSMLIWLGKQYLGQKEPSQQVEVGHDTLDTARAILSGVPSAIK